MRASARASLERGTLGGLAVQGTRLSRISRWYPGVAGVVRDDHLSSDEEIGDGVASTPPSGSWTDPFLQVRQLVFLARAEYTRL